MKKDLFKKEFERFLQRCRKEGRTHPNIIVVSSAQIVFPYRNRGGDSVRELVPALMFSVVEDKETYHTVIVSWTPDGFKIWCADGLFSAKGEGRKKYEKIYKQYIELCSREGIASEHIIPRDTLFRDGPCSFWKEGTCRHVKYVQTLITHQADKVFNRLEELRQTYFEEEGNPEVKSFTTILRSLAFKVPVLIEGEQGSGKTYTAYQLAQNMLKAEEVQHLVIGQGDNGVEIADLLGYYIKAHGSLVWKDGVLTEAFRKAQKGKTILLFDEFYRLRDKEKDIFVRALTVFPDGKLRLRTGRVVSVEDGVAQEEVLEVPKENLWVIATTNVGSQFMVDEADPALQERFIVLRKDTEEDELKKILASKCDECGVSITVVGSLIKFWKGTKKLFQAGELSGYATTRTLSRAIELAPTKDKEGVKEGIWMQRYLWVGRDSSGFPIPEQEETLKELLDRSFS